MIYWLWCCSEDACRIVPRIIPKVINLLDNCFHYSNFYIHSYTQIAKLRLMDLSLSSDQFLFKGRFLDISSDLRTKAFYLGTPSQRRMLGTHIA